MVCSESVHMSMGQRVYFHRKLCYLQTDMKFYNPAEANLVTVHALGFFFPQPGHLAYRTPLLLPQLCNCRVSKGAGGVCHQERGSENSLLCTILAWRLCRDGWSFECLWASTLLTDCSWTLEAFLETRGYHGFSQMGLVSATATNFVLAKSGVEPAGLFNLV